MTVELNKIKDFIVEWNNQNTNDFYNAAKEIWENPELSMQEYKSSKLLIDLLKKTAFQLNPELQECLPPL